LKFYRGSAAAARSYVEADHSRADYYLSEGSGVAEHDAVTVGVDGVHTERRPDLDGASYERWVADPTINHRRRGSLLHG